MAREVLTVIENYLSEKENATIFHTPEWYNIINEEFKQKNETFYFATAEKNGTLVGVFPFVERINNLFFKTIYSPISSYYTPYGGLVCDNEFVFNYLLRWLSVGFSTQQIEIYSSPYFNLEINKGLDIEFLETAVLDISVSEEEIWKNLSRNTRRNIIKAEKSGMTVETNSINVDDYFEILKKHNENVDLATPEKSFLKKIKSHFDPLGMSDLVVAKYEGKTIAGVHYLCYRSTLYSWTAATRPEYNKYSPGFLIMWETIKKYSDAGFRKLDFVRLERERLPGIARFKLSWKGDIVKYPYFRKYQYIGKLKNKLNDYVHR